MEPMTVVFWKGDARVEADISELMGELYVDEIKVDGEVVEDLDLAMDALEAAADEIERINRRMFEETNYE